MERVSISVSSLAGLHCLRASPHIQETVGLSSSPCLLATVTSIPIALKIMRSLVACALQCPWFCDTLLLRARQLSRCQLKHVMTWRFRMPGTWMKSEDPSQTLLPVLRLALEKGFQGRKTHHSLQPGPAATVPFIFREVSLSRPEVSFSLVFSPHSSG